VSKRKPLDVRTLRCISRRLRKRSRELDAINKRNKALIGQAPSLVRVGRANEADLWADHLLNEARAKPKSKRKGSERKE